MPATTPPKGRPTPGRRDRKVAQRRVKSRSSTKRFVWVILAVVLISAVLVLGSGTGGNTVNTGGTQTNAVLGLVGLRATLTRSGPRS